MSAKRMQIREEIQITGASENNLKRVNVNIPKERLVVVAGVSGSGKSSLAFDTVAAESICKFLRLGGGHQQGFARVL